MLLNRVLLTIVVSIPVVAGLVVVFSMADLSERHHTHHDTYAISGVVSRTMVLDMVFMAVLGSLTGWLCHLGVFKADPLLPLSFFAAFQLTLLFAFTGVCRSQVTTYDDRMFVRPWIGRRRQVAYADIVRMERRRSLLSSLFSDLLVTTADGKRVRVSGLFDVEHILVRIDRFDVLA